jgi:hypothetical protein
LALLVSSLEDEPGRAGSQLSIATVSDMKSTGLRVGVLLALHVLWASPSHSQAPGDTVSAEEVSKQSAIYRSKGDDVPKGYVVGRSLSSYLYVLPAGFTRSLAGLGPNDRWLDIGAGEGRAVLDYCTSKYDGTLLKEAEPGAKKAKAIAMSKPARSSTCSAGGCVTIQAKSWDSSRSSPM